MKRNGNVAAQERLVKAWNDRYAIGIEVEYRELLEEPGKNYKTRSDAQMLSGHTAVVWLEGKSGCVCLDHCKPASNDLSGNPR